MRQYRALYPLRALCLAVLFGSVLHMIYRDQFKHHTYYTLRYDDDEWSKREVPPSHETICFFVALAPQGVREWSLSVDTVRGSGAKAYVLTHNQVGDVDINTAPQKTFDFLHPEKRGQGIRVRPCVDGDR